MATHLARTKTAPLRPTSDNPFPYGWRYRITRGPDGKVDVEQIPLTLQDVLYPQEEDVIAENTQHRRESTYLACACEDKLADQPGSLVLNDCIINWGHKKLGTPCPDVAVIFNVADPEKRRGTFYVAKEKTRPSLIVEIVSPSTRDNDVEKKFADYHREKVPLYVIVDQEVEDGPRELLGYRYTPTGYVQMTLDAQGRLLLKPVDLLIGLKDERVVCYDAQTGEEFGNYVEERKGRKESERRSLESERRSREAERRSRESERRLRKETEARANAENRNRELEAELSRLRKKT